MVPTTDAKVNSLPPSHSQGGTVLKSEILNLAGQDKLRLRAFGETVIYGRHKPFDGDLEQAVAALSQLIDRGLVTVYRDEDGLFVGPSNPILIDGAEVGHVL